MFRSADFIIGPGSPLDRKICRTNYNYLSENLSHDSFFVKECIKKLTSLDFFQSMDHISFWSDCGNHFRSGELRYYLLNDLYESLRLPSIKVNYFAEYHGKSEVDGHFGVLARWLKEEELYMKITSIGHLLSVLQQRAIFSHSNPLFWPYFWIIKIKPRNKAYHKLVVKDSRSYLCILKQLGRVYGAVHSDWNVQRMIPLTVWAKTVKDKRRTKKSSLFSSTLEAVGKRGKDLIEHRLKLLQNADVGMT